MRCVLKLLMATALVVAAVAPALAATIEPGTYSMQWTVPEKGADILGTANDYYQLTKMGAAQAKKAGAASANCLVAAAGPNRLVVDESKGTGKGFDTVYVLPNPGSAIDLKGAPKAGLKKEGSCLVSDESSRMTMEIPVGPKDAPVARKVAVRFHAHVSQIKDRKGKVIDPIGYANICMTTLGTWAGTIKTDRGEKQITLVDGNHNGTYDDALKPGEVMGECDGIIIGPLPDTPDQAEGVMTLGKAVSYDGKLYTAKVARNGESVEIAPYTGESGTLKFQIKDGKGNPGEVGYMMMAGEGVAAFARGDKDQALVPGKYTVYSAAIRARGADPKPRAAVSVQVPKPIEITAGKTTTLSMGGPITLRIAPSERKLTAKRGATKNIDLSFKTTDGSSVQFNDVDGIPVTIRNAKGAVLKSGKASFG